jgi:hypothetical protein
MMRGTVLAFGLVLGLTGIPVTSALAAEDIDSRLKALEEEVEALKKQLNSLTLTAQTRPGATATPARLPFGVEQVAPKGRLDQYKAKKDAERH